MASLLARVLCADRKGEVSKWCAVASGCATLVLYADMWVDARRRSSLAHSLEALESEAHERARLTRRGLAERREAPALWIGHLSRTSLSLNGPAMLPAARRGTQVEVVEEGARLLTVRNCRTGEVGWYPRSWVQAA